MLSLSSSKAKCPLSHKECRKAGRGKSERGHSAHFWFCFLHFFPLNVCKLDYSFLRKGKLLLDSRICEEGGCPAFASLPLLHDIFLIEMTTWRSSRGAVTGWVRRTTGHLSLEGQGRCSEASDPAPPEPRTAPSPLLA